MMLAKINISFENVLASDGITVSVVGITIVFVGLVLTSLYIASLPWLLGTFYPWIRTRLGIRESTHGHGHGAPVVADSPSSQASGEMAGDDPALSAVIAYVVHSELELERLSDYHKITIRRDENQQTWGIAGKMRTLATRKTLLNR